MHIPWVGIDLSKITHHLMAWHSARRQGAGEDEVHSEATAGLQREHAELADRLGDLLGAHFLDLALRKQGHV
jgi:hypothetical protein